MEKKFRITPKPDGTIVAAFTLLARYMVVPFDVRLCQATFGPGGPGQAVIFERNLEIFRQAMEAFKMEFPHELTHAFLNGNLGVRASEKLPKWFHEAFAIWGAGCEPQKTSEYNEYKLCFQFLDSKFGREVFKQFFKETIETRSAEASLHHVYGINSVESLIQKAKLWEVDQQEAQQFFYNVILAVLMLFTLLAPTVVLVVKGFFDFITSRILTVVPIIGFVIFTLLFWYKVPDLLTNIFWISAPLYCLLALGALFSLSLAFLFFSISVNPRSLLSDTLLNFEPGKKRIPFDNTRKFVRYHFNLDELEKTVSILLPGPPGQPDDPMDEPEIIPPEVEKYPLHKAVSDGDTLTFWLLLFAKADVNWKNGFGETPLHVAAQCQASSFAEMLMIYGAEVNLQDGEGRTPIHIAVKKKDPLSTARMLSRLKDNETPNWQDNRGETPLHYAAEKELNEDRELGIISNLLNRGADPNIKNSSDRTSFQKAVESGGPGFVRLFLSKGANLNVEDRFQDSPIHLALKSNCFGEKQKLEIVSVLLKAGSNVNAENLHEKTPLHLAAIAGLGEVMKVLLKNNADPNSREIDDRTPLHVLISARGAPNNLRPDECANLVKILIEGGANPNLLDKMERPPLHLAIEKQNAQTVKVLLVSNADPNFRDSEGRSPLELARTAGCQEIIDLLVENGAI